MICSRSALFRSGDALILAAVFLFQNVLLNYYIILHFTSSFLPFLWFLGDFFCLLLFSFTFFLAHRHHEKVKKRARRSASRASFVSGTRSNTPEESVSSDESGRFTWWIGNSQLPFSYISWMFYSLLIIFKIAILFKSNIAQSLSKDDILGPQMLKFCIGLSAIVFSLLVEAHHDAQTEPLRNAYLNSIAYGVALEILDSTSFLSMLIPAEQHLIYPFSLENYIIALAALNIMLPAITVYKLSATNFGRVYNVPLESLYKFLHLMFVNVPFLGVRVFLWKMFSTDTAIFMIKNIYGIIAFVRGVYPDIVLLRTVFRRQIRLHMVKADNGISSQRDSVSNGLVNRHSVVLQETSQQPNVELARVQQSSEARPIPKADNGEKCSCV